MEVDSNMASESQGTVGSIASIYSSVCLYLTPPHSDSKSSYIYLYFVMHICGLIGVMELLLHYSFRTECGNC